MQICLPFNSKVINQPKCEMLIVCKHISDIIKEDWISLQPIQKLTQADESLLKQKQTLSLKCIEVLIITYKTMKRIIWNINSLVIRIFRVYLSEEVVGLYLRSNNSQSTLYISCCFYKDIYKYSRVFQLLRYSNKHA